MDHEVPRRLPEPPLSIITTPMPAPPTHWPKSVDILGMLEEIKAAAADHSVTFTLPERRRVFVSPDGSLLTYLSAGVDTTELSVTRPRPSKERPTP